MTPILVDYSDTTYWICHSDSKTNLSFKNKIYNETKFITRNSSLQHVRKGNYGNAIFGKELDSIYFIHSIRFIEHPDGIVEYSNGKADWWKLMKQLGR